MYPESELTCIHERIAELRQSIGQSRTRCAHAATRVVQPLRWFDEARRLWLAAAPYVVIGRLLARFFRR